MQDDTLVVAGGPQLSQGARVINTFIAPSRTFTDILRSAACWLPIIIMVLITIGWTYAVDKKVGFTSVTEQQIAKNARAEEAMQQLSPDQRAGRMRMMTVATKWSTYASAVFVLMVWAVEALLMWGTFNFALGAQTRFSQVFAVMVFAGLPRCLMWLLSACLLFGGVGTDNFDIRNPVGTNIGYYLTDSPQWVKTAGAFFDVLGFWTLGLMILGMAIISRKKISQSAAVVIGWWFLILLVVTGISAM